LCLGVVVTIGSAACAPSPDPSTFTVEYFRAHPQEREQTLATCENDPGGIGREPACVNARAAERIEGIGSMRDRRPLDLPTDAEPRDAEKRQ
jgi:hypothetical protein